jgi:periplasmic protein TonB
MIEAADQRRWLTCWSVSILLHVGLLIFGVALLIHPARFNVQTGQSSMEIDLVLEATPVPASTAAAPKPSALPFLSEPVPAAPTSAPIKTEITVKHQTKNSPSPSKSSPTKETSNASKGAIEAQPDDLHNEPPEYPDESRTAREQGVVILRVDVTADGEPANVTILKSSGYFRLDQAARRAVQHWKFHPALTAGIAVSSEADVPVRFRLE